MEILNDSFLLTESLKDLCNRLSAIYSNLETEEENKGNSNTLLIAEYEKKAIFFHAEYKNLDIFKDKDTILKSV